MAESVPSVPPAAAMVYAAATDVGQRREQNEDAHGEFELPGGDLLLVVADGMGGHLGGEVASRIAVEAIGQIAQHSPAPDPREKLHNGLLVAHQRVTAHAESAGIPGMGTTAVAVYLRGSEAYVAHIGDSRVYHLRNGAISWRTLDHTRVERMVRMGILSPEQAKNHPDANIVTRAIGHNNAADGAKLEPEVQEEPLLLLAGDVIVLCSDGVYDGVTDEEIAAIASEQPPHTAVRALVDLANERGGTDNITVTILKYGERPAQSSIAKPAAVEPPVASPTKPGSTQPALRGDRTQIVAGVMTILLVAGGLGAWLILRRGAGRVPTGGVTVQDLGATPDLAKRPPVEPAAPLIAPSAPKAAPSAPSAAPSAPKAAPSAPSAAPSAPKAAPSAPRAAPSAQKAAPSAPKAAPSAPKAAPSAPKAAPSAPKAAPSAPKAAPSAPKAAPSAPGAAPSALPLQRSEGK